MGRGINKLEIIIRQNELLKEQNDLLRKQNELMELSTHTDDGREIFVENINRDEIRDGFIVTSQRKKLWNVQLNLIAELDRICKKHNIRWFAYGGTLLGAVRHRGFIPWDDDVDISMLRPDYEKFKQVIRTEIKEPYFVDAWHDYRLEDEEPDIVKDKSCLQVVKHAQRRDHPKWWPFWPIIKIKDSRTTFVQYLDRPYVHQGIWIDVFPFDPVPPFSDRQQAMNFQIERELMFAMALPGAIIQAIKMKQPLLVNRQEIEKFLALLHRQKAAAIDNFALKNFTYSAEYVGQLRGHILSKYPLSYALKNFEKIVYLPFEKIKIPAPVGYEDCLTAQYGDWHEHVFGKQHAKAFSADFSFKDFFEQIKFL